MPSTYAHYYFGKKMIALYPYHIRSLVQEYRNLYDIGLHGPDILFYYRPLKRNSVNSVGFSMHEKPGSEFFSSAASKWQLYAYDDAQRDRHTAYLLGFLCHYALDRSCHGYVEKKIHVCGISHTEIETEFDRYLLSLEGNDPLRTNLAQHIQASNENARIISDFFPTISDEQILQALQSMIRCHHLLQAPYALKRWFLLGVLRITGNHRDMSGMVMKKHPNPECNQSNLALKNRLEQALTQCQSLTQDYLYCLEHQIPVDSSFNPTFGADDQWQNICL